MEKETIVPQGGKEMNFFDLCAACWRALVRGMKALIALLGYMLRLTYRYWWIVLTLMALGVCAALYYTRSSNIIYKVNAVAMVNGPTIQQFNQAFAPLCSGRNLSKNDSITSLLASGTIRAMQTFRVIDFQDDGTADYIDFKNKSSVTDTVNVQMKDRICIQFRIKARNIDTIPYVEQALLDYFNSNEAMLNSYAKYLNNLQNEVLFNHSQMQKLDSLTTHYYFHGHPGREPLGGAADGIVFMGDWRVHLFLDDIYEQSERTQLMDQRLLLATSPITLENHFAADPRPVNGRMKMIILFALFTWALGCALAELLDKRKAILGWLKS